MSNNGSPREWKHMTLADVADWGSGGTPLRTNSTYFGGGIPWVVIGDLNDGVVDGSRETISEEGLQHSSAKWVEPGSVLIAMYGSIGKLGITGRRLTTNQAIAFAVPKDGVVSSKYLFWYLRRMRPELISAGKGGTQKNISQTVLKRLPILVPARQIQDRIVCEIEKYWTLLDAAASALQRCRTNLLRHRSAILQAACAGRLLPGMDPGGWSKTTYGELTELITSGSRGWKRYLNRGSGRFILAANVRNGRVDLDSAPAIAAPHSAEASRTRVRKGDILVTIVGEAGRVGRVREDPGETYVSQSVALTRPRDPSTSSYLEIWIRAPSHGAAYLEAKEYGVGRGHLLLSHLKEMPVALPSAPEREAIVAEVERRFSVLDSLEDDIRASLARGETLRTAILVEALSGRLISGEGLGPEILGPLGERPGVR